MPFIEALCRPPNEHGVLFLPLSVLEEHDLMDGLHKVVGEDLERQALHEVRGRLRSRQATDEEARRPKQQTTDDSSLGLTSPVRPRQRSTVPFNLYRYKLIEGENLDVRSAHDREAVGSRIEREAGAETSIEPDGRIEAVDRGKGLRMPMLHVGLHDAHDDAADDDEGYDNDNEHVRCSRWIAARCRRYRMRFWKSAEASALPMMSCTAGTKACATLLHAAVAAKPALNV